MRKHILFILLIVNQVSTAFSQIKINEFLASNASVNTDPQYGSNADWVELYNAGSTEVNLNGYYLTDNLSIPTKWQITQNVNIPAKGFLLIWADNAATGLHTNFKLSASGEQLGLFNATSEMVDTLSFAVQNIDISYGRTPDGSNMWNFFQTPTPGATNGSIAFTGKTANFPRFVQKGGLYQSGLSVEMLNDLGGTMRYTLDGSDPITTSTIYTGAIPVAKTTIIRARVFKQDEIPGPTVTQSYFINSGSVNNKLSVVSIATNPENFWDSEKGIYVQTFKPDWEVPVNIELFENDGSNVAAINQQAGIKVNGLYSWQLPQKMLGVYFKKQYGESTLAYQLFYDRNRKTFNNFALRASGNDWGNTMFRDGMVQQSCQNFNMKLDNMAFRPSVVYVNGQYMGIHNMREKVDEDFIASNYNLSKDSFDLVENEDFAETGNLAAYSAFKALYAKDLSVQANYDAVAAVMDIENFTDLIVTELYSGNSSIDHNVMAWKPKEGGKWKWVLMDLDRGFFGVSSELITFYNSQTVWPFSQLMNNANYKKYFGTRLANHLYTTFNPIRMDKRIDYHKSLIEAEIPNHIDRWLGTTSLGTYGVDAMPSVDYWNNEVAKLKTFADARPAVLLTDLIKYGFSASAQLSLSVIPSTAGDILFNGMKMSETSWSGNYPQNLAISLTAVDKPGYTFKGWAPSTSQVVLAKKSTWKYLDDGTDQNTTWYATGFNDAAWKSGAGILGYGDAQSTIVSYGTSNSNKYPTTFFRTTFTLSEEIKSAGSFILNLLRDDGAVVYLNGHEIVRSNMPTGTITYKTLASSTVDGTGEATYNSYVVDPSYFVTGTNVLAAEVHQRNLTSSDISFDAELTAQVPNTANLVSTDHSYDLTLIADQKLTAVYESKGQNLVPDTLTQSTTFFKANSPYILQGDVVIPANVTLTIEPGVEIFMEPKSNFIVYGSMKALGTAKDTIVFKMNPFYTDNSWGSLCFLNTTDTVKMSYVTLKDASKGPLPVRDVAAISTFKSTIQMDHMTVVSIDFDPIVIRYGSVVLTNSTLHSQVVGNLINVKNAYSRIENCILEGNNFPDTDAIDYDDVDNGVIKNVVIRNFGGSNSDAIDLGESSNVSIDSVLIYNIFDKGVSIGARTTVHIKDVTIMNTNIGFGVKDSSTVYADACTFYSVGTPIANYEKVVGRAGGNVFVTNSILSNSNNFTYTSDDKSYTKISYSLSDNDPLPDGLGNRFGNPGFNAPGFFDFGLSNTSPAKLAGMSQGVPVDLGSVIRNYKEAPYLLISDIFYNLNKSPDRTEFIALYNPSDDSIDLSGYTLSNAFDFVFPQGSVIESGKKVIIAKDLTLISNMAMLTSSWAWTSGSLANEGELVRLSNKYGIVVDQVFYGADTPWPIVSGADEKVLTVLSPELDNHFGENWKTSDYTFSVGVKDIPSIGLAVYPNPTRGNVTIQSGSAQAEKLEIFTITGQRVYSGEVQGQINLDLSQYGSSILFAKMGKNVEKIVVLGK